MLLENYEDFLSLNTKQPSIFQAIRGLNTSGKNIELEEQGFAFAAAELELDILEFSEQQLKKLKFESTELLRKFEIPNPNKMDRSKYIDDLTKWSVVTISDILAFILKNKEFNMGYTEKYKD